MLSDVYQHETIDGNKYFIDCNSTYGDIVRQIQYANGIVTDASDQDDRFLDLAKKDRNLSEYVTGKDGWQKYYKVNKRG